MITYTFPSTSLQEVNDVVRAWPDEEDHRLTNLLFKLPKERTVYPEAFEPSQSYVTELELNVETHDDFIELHVHVIRV